MHKSMLHIFPKHFFYYIAHICSSEEIQGISQIVFSVGGTCDTEILCCNIRSYLKFLFKF